jgi:hypothetical protein
VSAIAATYLVAIGSAFAEDLRLLSPSWNYGTMFGGVLTASSSVDSTAAGGFYKGAFDAYATPYAGVFANVNVATYGRSSAPFGTWVLSVSPIADIMVPYPLKFDGTFIGVPVKSSGTLTQADFLAALKATTVLNRDYNLSIFAGLGAAVRWGDGMPTGGGPRIIGHETAPAYRFGVELARAAAPGVNIGVTAAYQRTESMRFDTTSAGEGFRFDATNQFMLGMTVTWGGAPPVRPQLQVSTLPRISGPGPGLQPSPSIGRINGLPPVGETRFAPNEVVMLVDRGTPQSAVDDIARRTGLTQLDSQVLNLLPATMYLLRIEDGRSVRTVIQALAGYRIVRLAQPNYGYELAQQTVAPAATGQDGEFAQYILQKLRIQDAHLVSKGANVSIAVIDSEIDGSHPDLAGAIAQRYSAVGGQDTPHPHGTGMAGAIAARQKLMGIAPSARLFAVHAFSPTTSGPGSTTFNVVKGFDWAASQGVRIINMSFSGPRDPALQRELQAAYDRGITLVAAAGNGGPTSPPLYPGADPNVIAVTATDKDDQVYARANRGRYIALAAPGVDIVTPAPNLAYQKVTGTSVSAAEISGIVALLLERNPRLAPADIRRILTSTAMRLGPGRRDVNFGAGLVDPLQAIRSADPRTATNSPRR